MPILSPGQIVRDTYEVERMLGEGAFAEVYRVKHRFMGRQAMKVFKTAGTTLQDIEQNLLWEALLLSKIRHPNIVEVFDANVLETGKGQYGYFTMTYVAGGTLERYWRSFGSQLMPVEQVVEVAKQACRGLAVAHLSSPPIVHRDIKPQNILVGFAADGLNVRLSDFGLAKAVNPLTLLVSAKGTLGFKPPESLENVDSCAADIWAIGTTIYLLLTDEMPFPMLGDRDVEDANRFLRPIRPPSIYNVNVDAGLESVIFRCLAAAPLDRYPNAKELLDDLEKWEPGYAPQGVSASQSRRGSKSAIVERSPHDFKGEAQHALREAMQIAQDPTRLMSAADLLEEAISKDPALRDRYESHLQLWRKGIMHVSTADLSRFPPRPGKVDEGSGPPAPPPARPVSGDPKVNHRAASEGGRLDLNDLLDRASRHASRGENREAARAYEDFLARVQRPGPGIAETNRPQLVRSAAFNLAQVLNKLKEYDRVLHWVDLGLRQAPTALGRAIAYAAQGEALCGLGREAEGRQAFENAARADPIVGRLNSADSLVRLGSAGQVAMAEQWVQIVLDSYGRQLPADSMTEARAILQAAAERRQQMRRAF